MKKRDPLKIIGAYHLLKSLGKGGMGEVFLAYDTLCQREIALKQIREDLLSFPAIRDRFLREALIAAQLTHPSIIPIYSIYQDAEKTYYTMPYIEGETLKQLLQALRKEKKGEEWPDRSLPTLARIFLNICQAIAYAHAKGILHRDLKPENVIIGKYGEVMILDWGLADFIENPSIELLENLSDSLSASDLTQPGKIVGTLSYLAPERALGEGASILTEIYALGAILYQILTLRLPFQRSSIALFRKQMRHEELIDPQEMAPYRDIPQSLAAMAKKCLAYAPTARYQTMEELLHDLENYIKGRPEWLLAAELDIRNKHHWEFQENVLFTKHIAITRETEIMEWVSLMISKESFSGNICLESSLSIEHNSNGIGFLLGIPETPKRKGVEEGYCLWLGSSILPGCTLFRSNVAVMHLSDLFLEGEREYHIRIEKIDHRLRFFLDGILKIDIPSHIPMTGTHLGVLYRDDHFHLNAFRIFVGSHNVMINCLSIPDAFLANQFFSQALVEYRRIGHCFRGRTEGREALFRAGITLLEKALNTKRVREKKELFSHALEEFSKLHATPGAPLEYLGKALVYKAEEEIEEEVKCLELALRKFPKHPLLSRVTEYVVFRLHEASSTHRIGAYHFALLSLRHLPQIFLNADHQRLLISLQKHWEPLPFIESSHLYVELQLAFWLTKPLMIVEMIEKTPDDSIFVANALFSLLELGHKSLAKKYLHLLSQDPQRSRGIEMALLPPIRALKAFFSIERTSLSFVEQRTLLFLFQRCLDQKDPASILPFFPFLDALDLSEEERFPFDLFHIWALLLADEETQAGNLLKKYPLELVQKENTPLFFLFGCYLRLSEGEEISLTHLKGVHEIPYPPTSTLLSHYLNGYIHLKGGWINHAFLWEKRHLLRELILFYHCSKEESLVNSLHKKLYRT
jgi:serine/threonine protein kinase